MISKEKRWKRLIVRWTAPKGLAALLLFLVSASLVEYLIVYSFVSGGLTDEFTWIGTFQVPYINWSFTLAVSPLFHLLPLSVLIVLVSSWAFLTKYLAFIPYRRKSAATGKPAIKRHQLQRRKFKSVREFFKRINKSIQNTGKGLKEAFLRIPIFSGLSRRLFFARTAVSSAMIILLVFVSFVLLAYSLAYPRWIYDAIINFYHRNPSFMAFVVGIQESLRSIAQALAPINNALLAAAPGFRNSLQSFGASAEKIAKLDITGKYLLVQNLAALICALIALTYGKYASALRFKKR